MTKTSRKAPSVGASARKSSKAASNTKPDAFTQVEMPAAAKAPKAPNKQQLLAALVVRDDGATLEQMIAATGWLPHTTRAALTGLKKKGYVISSDKVDGVRTYRAIAPE
jgi:hypothetical protein